MPAAHRQRIDHDVQQGHERARQGHQAKPARAAPGPARAEHPAGEAEGCIGQERKRERREARDVGEEQLRARGCAGVVIDPEGHPHPGGRQLGYQRDEQAPEQEPERARVPEVARTGHQEEGQEADHVRPQHDGACQQGRGRPDRIQRVRHELTIRNSPVFFKDGAGLAELLC